MKLTTSEYAELVRRHPNLAPQGPHEGLGGPRAIPGTKKRIRQSVYRLNKLESEWLNALKVTYPNYPRPRAHAVRFRLANGVDYTPDIFAASWPAEGEDGGPVMPTAWEIKGKHSWDDAIVKIKVAAHEWPEIRWWLVWKDYAGTWAGQEVRP